MKLNLPTTTDIRHAYQEGEEAVVALFSQVMEQVEALATQLSQQAELIQALEVRLGKNSQNSSKPPSTDGYAKPPVEGKRTNSLRKAGQKPKGGQPGHSGNTLKQTAHPDLIEEHAPEVCGQCGEPLAEVAVAGYEERQVYDIPALRIEITAHRALQKVCPVCGSLNRGNFPAGVSSPAQYGDGVKALGSYLTCQHYLPLERTTQIIEDLFQHRISEAVVLGATNQLAEDVKPAEAAVKALLSSGDILQLDETGLRVMGKLHWVHAASTAKLTYYNVHTQRGVVAMDAADILPNFKGIAVHDHWKPYFRYENCGHALCNAHHLRELQAIETLWEQPWAKDMAALLCEIDHAVNVARLQNQTYLPETLKTDFHTRYDDWVARGYEVNPPPPPPVVVEGKPKRRGRVKQSAPRNLLDRLKHYKAEVLSFMEDFRVPFSNNLAERDMRMVKVKQKVSGCFRTMEGAAAFVRIRGYCSTARKNGENVMASIKAALRGNPFVPTAA
jgi:transposase